MHQKDAHCSYCGRRYPPDLAWPRACSRCKNLTYRNPLPVAVVLVPVGDGLLAVRRGIEPAKGKLALPGGYVDFGETWQQAGAREVFEETGLRIDPAEIADFRVGSSPVGVLVVFGLARKRRRRQLPKFVANPEVAELAVLDGREELAFPLHTDAVADYFARRRKARQSRTRGRKSLSKHATFSAVLTLAVLASSAAAADDPWQSWRERQRAELADLPKPPAPPEGDGSPLDRFLAAHWKKHGVAQPPVVDDRTFARRAYLDVIGLLPTPEQLERFEKDAAADKRAKLVDALLADDQGYTEHWMSFWNDLLRNDEQTNIDGLRKPITQWLYKSLRENKPLDLFVAELLNPGRDGPDGYLKGVNWRGRVNASQTPPIQAAQNVSQVFLASSLKCASCHDSFINEWKLEQAYGLASFFAAADLEMHRCDKATGKVVPPKFLFAGLGDVPAKADLEARHQAVAEMVTRPKNPRFAKTLVNRLWKRLLGRGLFEPVDNFDNAPPNSELLDWLAYDFMAHDYDAKHVLRQILLSRVYQAPVTPLTKAARGKEPPLLGPVERRLTSEQYLDAIAQVTGHWPKGDVMNVAVANPNVRAWRQKKPDALATALGRPNREQVCTERNQESTVLQALELVNGRVLSDRLRDGAKALLASDLGGEENTEKVVRALYLRALGRQPATEEVALARPLLGAPKDKAAVRQEGWEDALWVLVMSPEFQFIR